MIAALFLILSAKTSISNVPEKLYQSFFDADMELLTTGQELRIDHIAVSRAFLTGAIPSQQEGELDKQLSDHSWVSVTI